MSSDQLSIKIALLEQNHQTMMDNLNELKQENKEQHNEIKETMLAIMSRLDKAIDSKADKSTVDGIVKFLWWFGGVVGTGVLGYMGLQLIKVIEKL